MNTVKKFNKAFPVAVAVSLALIAAGIAGIFIRGINFGIDFVPGLVEEIRIAPPAVKVTYSGNANVTLNTTNTALELVITGSDVENETKTFTYGQNPTVSLMAHALETVPGVKASVAGSGDADSYGIYTDSASSTRLSASEAVLLYVSGKDSVSVDDVRSTLSALNVTVKELGTADAKSFQIRAAANKDDSNEALQNAISSALKAKYGADNIATIKTDFVGSQFSTSLAVKSIILALATLFIIWLYATIRFHWDFALGAIVALLHDCLIMFAFIAWAQVELSTTSFAAVLTIFGYSINATVVILDRVRENIRLVETKDFNDILNTSITSTLNRSVITTVTTLFASVALLVFTTGAIHDFAAILTVGLISGCYSSMFISQALISFTRRNWEPGEWQYHVKPHVKVVNLTK